MRTPAILLHSTTAAADLSPSYSTTAADGLSPSYSTTSTSTSSSSSPGAISIDSDTVVILASLLCALICVAGLALVARCACHRARRPAPPTNNPTTTSSSHLPPPPPPKGLKKKAIDALPTVAFASAATTQGQGECAICLAEFAAGEELRVLPHCGHGFHMVCIDTWLGAHGTCPSCRATIGSSPPPPLPGRCRRCGATCDDVVDSTSAAAAGDESFLP